MIDKETFLQGLSRAKRPVLQEVKTKECRVCKKEFSRPRNESSNQWVKVKYCSIPCHKEGVMRETFAKLGYKRKGMMY